MAIKLSLPRVGGTPEPGVETRRVFVEEWVEGLAYAHPPVLLDQTLESLERLNRQPMKAARRIELLDLHVRPYAFALDFRRNQEPAQTAAALTRQRAVSRRLRLCAVAMALGYKQALCELGERRSPLPQGRDARLALQRAALFSSLALLHCYDEYRPTLPRLWLEIIALYKVAARAAMDAEPVPCAVEDELFSQSTATCFKRLCLTSLVDPYHLAYGELWRVYQAFGASAADAEVREVAPARRPAGLFVIDPSVDARPTPLAQAPATPGRHCRLLDANPVLSTLRERHRAADPDDPLASHVLAAMIRALGLPPKRHTPRESTEGHVKVAPGLSTAHHFLAGRTAEPSAGGGNGDDGVQETGERYHASYRHEPWRLVDEGPGGVGILRREHPRQPVGVGELVAMQFPLRGDADDEWSVGVVRWLTVDGDEDHQAGVQMIAESATPVMCYSEAVTDTITRIPRPALAIPDLDGAQGSTLLTPRGLFTRGTTLRVLTERGAVLVQAVGLSESTAAFDRFSYRILDAD